MDFVHTKHDGHRSSPCPGHRASGALRPVEPQEPGRNHREGRVPMVRRPLLGVIFSTTGGSEW